MESSPSIKAISNWKRSGGCDFAQAIQMKITHEDIFVRPELDEIISEQRAVLLSSPNRHAEDAAGTVACELALRIFPRYKIEALTLVCSASKLEVFLGPLKEYIETVYGAIIQDESDGEPMLSYRYDIEIQKSGVVELTLKLLTCSEEICIYGLLLQIAPNPNGITTLLPNSINLDNVNQMLENSNQKLSANAGKCKSFMQMCNKVAAAKQQGLLGNHSSATASVASSIFETPPKAHSHQPSLLDQMKQMLLESQTPMTAGCGDGNNAGMPQTLDQMIKSHIDVRLNELEVRLNARLDAMAAQQMEKLNAIQKMLEIDNSQ